LPPNRRFGGFDRSPCDTATYHELRFRLS